MAGELSMDMDTKTLRIHDGATLGGFPLARADQVGIGDSGPGTEFDIESVAPEFWNALFAAHNLRPVRFLQSALCNIANNSYAEFTFDGVAMGTDISVASADCVLVCQTPEAGYAVGDVAHSFGIGNRTNPRPNLFPDSNGLRAHLPVGVENFWVSHKTTGIAANITNANWKIKFRVWC